jgi:hypothetical protein
MLLIDISDELHRELNPDDMSISSITYWLRANFGKLNSLLGTLYTLDSAGVEVSPELGEQEKVIFKKLYTVYYYDDFIRRNLGAASYDSIIEVDSDGAKVKKVNKTEIAKTYMQLKKSETDLLNQLINSYRMSNSTPLDVSGDDIYTEVIRPSNIQTRTRNEYQ